MADGTSRASSSSSSVAGTEPNSARGSFKSQRSMNWEGHAKSAHGRRRSHSSHGHAGGGGHDDDFDDNSLSIAARRKHFNLARELRSVG